MDNTQNSRGWTAAIGKKLISTDADEHHITLQFEDGISAVITSGGGYNAELSWAWLRWEVKQPNDKQEVERDCPAGRIPDDLRGLRNTAA